MNIKYRPEIDGLRAISILVVVFFHAGFNYNGLNPFKGGYVGVDIFFVISGYLITSIILQGLKEGTFSFRQFYMRRARRLLPSLFTVLLVSIPFSWMLLLPKQLEEYAWSVASSLVFSANILFWTTGDAYWAGDSSLKPFLHLWSLSVEEQFYILFPIILCIIWHFFRNHLLTILILLGLLSLQFADFLTPHAQDFTFYMLPARAWELMAGAVLAKAEMDIGRTGNKLLATIGSAVGIYLIAYSVMFFDEETKHPSFVTLIPVLGSMLLIWCMREGDLIAKALSHGLMTGIGKISYTLYLWHFPALTFLKISSDNPSEYERAVVLALALILSIATYFLIETPLRYGQRGIRAFWIYSSISLIFIAAYSLAVISTSGFKSRMPEIIGEDFQQTPWTINRNSKNELCFGNTTFCRFDVKNPKATVFLIGDSTLEAVAPYLYPRLNDEQYSVVTMNSGACYFMPNFDATQFGKVRNNPSEPCDKQFQESRVEEINRHSNAIVVIGGMLNAYIGEIDFEGYGFEDHKSGSPAVSYISSVKKLLDDGHRVIQLAPLPRVDTNLSEYIFNILRGASRDELSRMTSDDIIRMKSHPEENYTKSVRQTFEIFDSIKHKNFSVLYPHSLFCDNLIDELCVFNDGIELFYADAFHPAKRGAEMISNLVVDAINSQVGKVNADDD